MRCHAALTGFTHTKAFFGLGKNHDRTSTMLGGGMIGGIDFFQVVATALQTIDLFIGQ